MIDVVKWTALSLVFCVALSAQAMTVSSNEDLILPSSIDRVIRLAEVNNPGSSITKVSIVVVDHGMSTDVSPRYSVYLTFASLAEMGNISSQFLINNSVYEFVSANRKKAGVYEIKVHEYRAEEGMVEVIQTIDTLKMFIDEKALRKSCGDFCDEPLKTSVNVEETVRKLN